MKDIKNLDRDVILKAISKIKNNPEKRNGRESTTYDLVHEGEAFPPILVLSEANKIVGGDELMLSDFNNSTNQAFSILRKNGFKIEPKVTAESSDKRFQEVVIGLGYDRSTKFFELLTTLTKRLDLSAKDPRVVYSVRNDQIRLAFTIGQRYCLVAQSTSDNDWGFISSRKIQSTKSEKFDGPAKAYWNKTNSFKDVKKEIDEIEKASIIELDRAEKSGYLKFNNAVFEKVVFSEIFREKFMNDLFNNVGNQTVESFADSLKKFLKQAFTDDLRTAHFKNSYNNLIVKVSFGQGNAAKIPWISFLHESQSTSHGIYPVYLLFKEKNILILAYGISETNKPKKDWGLDDVMSIEEYFNEHNLGIPHRYGSSYVFKVYDLEYGIENYPIDQDLLDITDNYKQIMQDEAARPKNVKFNISKLKDDLLEANLFYHNNLITQFSIGLITKNFQILTGLSGSGKTKIAQAFAQWITEDKKQINLVPVGADWTNREPLLGYPNALEVDKYVLPESGVLQLILEAVSDPIRPYFLILDEMNLSHVERYFADFLSAIESGEEIKLHQGFRTWKAGGYDIPPTLTIPKNLFIIGTVNIDETTYMFSPKVLDRANVIEFRVSKDEMKSFLKAPVNVKLSLIEGNGALMAQNFVNKATSPSPGYTSKENLSEELVKFFSELSNVGAEFGYRTANEINRFASLCEHFAENWEFNNIMDASIAQKLLPKLHGSRRKLEKVLFSLGQLCVTEGEAEELLKKPESINWDNVKYPISFEKIVRMHKGLVENGFTSFAEA